MTFYKSLCYCTLALLLMGTLHAEDKEDAAAAPQPVAGLIVKVTNLKNNKGTVRVALFNTKESWTEKPMQGLVVTPKELTAVATFVDLKPGTYAVSTYEDVNDNGKLDTNFLGIPTERYGFSNDASGTFGPPDYADATFEYEGGSKEITIKVE